MTTYPIRGGVARLLLETGDVAEVWPDTFGASVVDPATGECLLSIQGDPDVAITALTQADDETESAYLAFGAINDQLERHGLAVVWAATVPIGRRGRL